MDADSTLEILPWLMRQGDGFGYVAITLATVVGALVGLGVWHVVRRALLRLAIGRPRRTLAEGPGTFVGILEADETVERFDDGTACAVTYGWMAGTVALSQAAGLRLRLDDGVLAIDGPVELLAGDDRPVAVDDMRTMERIARAAPTPTEGEIVEAGDAEPGGRVRSVQAGERVLARGTVVRRAHVSAARDYRSAPGQWVLDPLPNGAVELTSLAAHRGAPIVLLPMILGAVLALALGWAMGNRALGSIPSEGAPPASIPLSAQLATVSPVHRAPALDRLLALYLDGAGPWDRRRAELALALGGPESCGQPFYDRIAPLSDPDFVAIALRCDQRQVAVTRLVAAGDFEGASALLSVDVAGWPEALYERRSTPLVHLLAGEPERAAAAVRARDALPLRRMAPGRADALGCLALALERGPSSEAGLADRRRAAADPSAASTCAALSALSLDDPDAQTRALNAITGDHLPRWIVMLQAARGSWPDGYDRAYQLATWGLSGSEAQGAIGLLEQVTNRSPPSIDLAPPRGGPTRDWLDDAEPNLAPALYYVIATATLANVHSLFGDAEAARSLLGQLAPYIERLEHHVPRSESLSAFAAPMPALLRLVRLTEGLIELRAGGTTEAERAMRAIDAASVISRSDLRVAWMAFEQPRTRERFHSSWPPLASLDSAPRDALVDAMLGDLEPLTSFQEEGQARWSSVVEQTASPAALSVLAIAIRGPATGRDRLRADLDRSSPASGSLPDDLRTLELHRQVAHAAGATDLEARIRAAQSRYRERLRDPFISLMWTIWSGL